MRLLLHLLTLIRALSADRARFGGLHHRYFRAA